jgi:hypothetical protein
LICTILPQYCSVSLRDGRSCTTWNTGPQWWIESNVGGLQIWLCSPVRGAQLCDNWELLKEKESGGGCFDGSYDPSLDEWLF